MLLLVLLLSHPGLQNALPQENKDSKHSNLPSQKNYPAAAFSSRRLTADPEIVGNVTTLAGMAGSAGSTNGIGIISRFRTPVGISISPDGAYALVADYTNHLIRHIILSTANVTTLAGVAGLPGSANGIGTNTLFSNPTGVSISPNRVNALVTEYSNSMIRHVIISTASVTTLAGTGSPGFANGIGINSLFSRPWNIAISPDGVHALVADTHNHLIRHIIISTASVMTIAGKAGSAGSTNGIGTISRFQIPVGISISPDGAYALVADEWNHLIRHIIISTANVTTLAGVAGSPGFANGIGTNSLFRNPTGVSISPNGAYALVTDWKGHLIRHVIISTASVTTLAGVADSLGSVNGIGSNSKFWSPRDVSISSDGVFALIAEWSNHLVRRILLKQSPFLSFSPIPSASPLFSFGVKIGDEEILSSEKAILVDYLHDTKRGDLTPSLSSSHLKCNLGKMIPISRVVKSSLDSDSNSSLSFDSILIKWRPATTRGTWDNRNGKIIISRGMLVFWIVNFSEQQIIGFIIRG